MKLAMLAFFMSIVCVAAIFTGGGKVISGLFAINAFAWWMAIAVLTDKDRED